MKTRKLRSRAGVILLGLGLVVQSVTASETAEEKEQRRRETRILKSVADSFVVIHYHFKKSERPQPPDDDHDFDRHDVLEKVLTKKTLDVTGVVVSQDGRVFAAENYLLPEVIDKITITGPDGKVLDARQERILANTCGQVLRVTRPLPEKWKPLSFAAGPKVLDMKSVLYGVTLNLHAAARFSYGEGAKDASFSVHRAHAARKRANQSDIPDYFQTGGYNETTVVCDSSGQVLGVTAWARIELGDGALAWRGVDILADPGLERAFLEKEIEERFAKYLYQVRITFRPPPKEDEEYDMGMYGSFWGRWRTGADEEQDMFIYGLAVAPDKLLLPLAMARPLVAGIDTISVEVDDEYVPAAFSGVLKECEGTVIELGEPRLAHVVDMDPNVSLGRGQFFWTVFGRELAGKDLLVNYNRWVHKSRGYENKLYPELENTARNGCWLLDVQGRFGGLYAGARRDYQRILPYLMGQGSYGFDYDMMSFGRRIRHFSGRGYMSSGEDVQIFDSSVLARILADLPSHYDRHITHMTKDEQKRRVWLGVEFTGVSKEMAKQLNLRKQTQDGRLGLIVNRIYRGSPAEKMGLVEGDVLLKLKVPEGPWPVDLKSEIAPDYEGPDWDEFDVPEEFEAMGFRPPRKRPWPGRDNFLTRMLYVIGEGVPVALTYVHEGKELRKEFVIERSPRDALSANKYKDEKLGLTVKDLTYEVHTALKLAEDEKAIVISKVEPGTPAALARINAFELIRAVDGQELASVEEFESALEKAKKEGRKSTRITVEWMGKTRLADLKFEAAGPGLRDMMKLIPGLSGDGR
ncbi:MAG: PDZ domain-containing protein [Planctomycetota bacterium]|jgi:hypothetical protein